MTESVLWLILCGPAAVRAVVWYVRKLTGREGMTQQGTTDLKCPDCRPPNQPAEDE